MATDKDLEQIRERTNLVSLVSAHTSLKKAGTRYKGRCPFHADKDPSFTVDEEKKLWHCFGCGVGGDMFTFVMQTENVGFGEAVEMLAKRAGITLTPSRPEERGRRNLKDKILKINDLASRYFFKVLISSKSGEKFLKYLEERKIPKDEIRSFKLGASQESWDALLNALCKKDFTPADVAQAGLAIARDSGGYYDRFRDRLIFPLFNVVGDIIGFAGRAYGDAMPKYLNTSETPLFDKGKMLYALDRAKKHVGEHGIIMTEGYMDVISLHKVGIRSAVASMGTALTQAQVDLLRRYTEKVTLCYDSDIAGDAASMRGIEMLVDRGVDIRVMSLPAGEDPDSIVREGGAEAFLERAAKASDYFSYFLEKSIARIGGKTPAQKRDVILQLAPLIERTPNEILKDEQIAALAERLSVAERHVQSAMSQAKEAPRKRGGGADNAAIERTLSGSLAVEKKIIEILLSSPEAAGRVLDALQPEYFEDRNNRGFFKYCSKYREKFGKFNPDEFLNMVHEQEVIRYISGIPVAGGRAAEAAAASVDDVLEKFIADVGKRQIADLQKQIVHAQKEGDMKMASQLAVRLSEIKTNMHKKK
jgi:DNA primase